MSERSGAEDKRTASLYRPTRPNPFFPYLDVCQFRASDRQDETGSWSAHFFHSLL